MKVREILTESDDAFFRTQLERTLEKLHDLDPTDGAYDRVTLNKTLAIKLDFFKRTLKLDEDVFNHLLMCGSEYLKYSFETTVESLWNHISKYGSNFTPIMSIFVECPTWSSESDRPQTILTTDHLESHKGLIAENICDDTIAICKIEKDIEWELEIIVDRYFPDLKYDGTVFNAFSVKDQQKFKQLLETNKSTPGSYILVWKQYSDGNMSGKHFSLMSGKQ